MNASRVLRAAHYQPMIKFIGKHHPPNNVSHTPAAHPAAPSAALPDSFANYRSKAQSHGPLGGRSQQSSASSAADSKTVVQHSFAGHSQIAHGAIGGHSGRALGRVEPDSDSGLVLDRSELPARFGRLKFEVAEIEAIESGGASLY